MRITNANILAQPNRPTRSISSEAAELRLANKPAHSTDRYVTNQRNGSAQFIDAEYVEFYSPSPQSLQQERKVLDSRLEVETSSAKIHSGSTQNLRKYQLKVHSAPPPGSYIDIFT